MRTAGGPVPSRAVPSFGRDGGGVQEDPALKAVFEGLSGEQRRAVEACLKGQHVFVTGVAGTGKSFTLKKILEAINIMHPSSSSDGEEVQTVAVCAPTGVAAHAVGGTTLTSLGGCGVPTYLKDLVWKRNKQNKKMWQGLKVLVIDEIGMVNGEFLDWLDRAVRDIRGDQSRPFGGIQLVMCGDFLQLVPIGKNAQSVKAGLDSPVPAFIWRQEKIVPVGQIGELAAAFAFQTALWREARFVCVQLTEVRRQGDKALVSHLNWLRMGGVVGTPLVQERGFDGPDDYFARRFVRPLPARGGIEPTMLFPTNREVGDVNEWRLHALPEGCVYPAIDAVYVDPRVPYAMQAECEALLWDDRDFYKKNLQAAEVVDLREGAQVTLTFNALHLTLDYRP